MTGVDFIEANVLGAIGIQSEVEQKPIEGYWAEIILHAERAGKYAGITVAKSMQPHIVELAPTIEIGHPVEPFSCASDAIGSAVLRFEKKEEMEYAIAHQSEWLKVNVK